jgi:hypothetical protein
MGQFFQVHPTNFSNLKWMNKNLGQVFHLSIIIDNSIHIIYSIEFEPYNFSISIMIHYFYFIGFSDFFFSILTLAHSFFFVFLNLEMNSVYLSRIYIYNIYPCQEGISSSSFLMV